MRSVRYITILIGAMLLASAGYATAQEFRATVKGQVVDSSKAAVPGATVTVHATPRPTRSRRPSATRTATTRVPFLRPGLYNLTVELSGFPKYVRNGMRLEVEPDRRDQRASSRSAVWPRRSTFPPKRRCSKPATRIAARSSTAPASPSCRCSRAARWRSRPSSPASTTTPRPIYLRPFDNGALADWSMNGGPEPQQRVPARRRAEQRQPGRQQHRLRAARRSGAGIQSLHQLVRRAVRPHRRRRRQHVAQVGDQLVPRRRLRLPAPQGAGRQLVPAQLAQRPKTGSVHRSVRLQRRRPDHQEQDVLPVHRREVPRRARPRRVFSTVPTPAMQERRFQRSRGCFRAT